MKVWSGTERQAKGMSTFHWDDWDAAVVGGDVHLSRGPVKMSGWRLLGGDCLLVWDEREGTAKREKCFSCTHRRNCWGPNFYSDWYHSCVVGKVDRWVSNTVMVARDEKRGGKP